MALLQIDQCKGKLQGKGNSFLGLLQQKHIKSGGVYVKYDATKTVLRALQHLSSQMRAHKVKRAIQLLCKSNQSSTVSRRRV